MKRRPQARLIKILARASRNCGVPAAVFWTLTPSELAEIERDAMEEFKVREELQERRTARLMATMFNCHPHKKRGSKTFTERDFLPKDKQKEGNRATERSLLDKIFWIDQTLRAQFRARSGVVKK